MNRSRTPSGDDDHLLLGMTYSAAADFLLASGWPEDYVRSAQDTERNGPLVSGKEIGYDVAQHIRNFMREKGYEQFSVAEVLYCIGYPNVGFARAFLSHAQNEMLAVTFGLMAQVTLGLTGTGSPKSDLDRLQLAAIFVDYFCLRQCVPDFDPPKVRAAIGTIGCLFAGLSVEGGSVQMLTRVWCGYELYCAIIEGAQFWAVGAYGPLDVVFAPVLSIDLRQCEANKPQDKATLMQFFNGLEGGVEAANKVIMDALRVISTVEMVHFFSWTPTCCAMWCCPPVFVALIIVLASRGVWTLEATILSGVIVCLCCLSPCIFLGFAYRSCMIKKKNRISLKKRLGLGASEAYSNQAAEAGTSDDSMIPMMSRLGEPRLKSFEI